MAGEPGLRDLEPWSMESEGSGAREHGIRSFPESRSKKGMILSLERAIFGGNFLLVSGPQQFSFGHEFLWKIPKED